MKTIRIDGKDYQVEDEVSDFCQQASKSLGELLAATGTDSHEKALATVAGLKEKASRVDELSAAMAKAEGEKRDAECKELLAAASRDGRLTPAKRGEIEKGENATLAGIAKNPETLKAFLDCLPVLAVAKPAPAPAAAQADANDPTQGGKRKFADLSYAERSDLFVTNRSEYDRLKGEADKK